MKRAVRIAWAAALLPILSVNAAFLINHRPSSFFKTRVTGEVSFRLSPVFGLILSISVVIVTVASRSAETSITISSKVIFNRE